MSAGGWGPGAGGGRTPRRPLPGVRLAPAACPPSSSRGEHSFKIGERRESVWETRCPQLHPLYLHSAPGSFVSSAGSPHPRVTPSVWGGQAAQL